MNRKYRDKIFETDFEFEYDTEHSHGVGLWIGKGRSQDFYIEAKTMGSWKWFNIVEAESKKEAIELFCKEISPTINIITPDQLIIVLESILGNKIESFADETGHHLF